MKKKKTPKELRNFPHAIVLPAAVPDPATYLVSN